MRASPSSNPFLDPTATAAIIEAFESFPVGLVLTDAAHRFVRVNRAASAFTGLAEQDLIGTSLADLLTADCHDQLAAEFAEESANGDLYAEHEWSLLRPDGSIATARVRTLRLEDRSGRTSLWLRAFESVDPGRQHGREDAPGALLLAEQAQRRSQAMVDAAAAALPVTFSTFDANLIFTSVVGGLQRAGTRADDFLGRHVSELTQDKATLAALDGALEGSQSTTQTVVNGRTYLTLSGPIPDQTGKFVGVVSVSTDVTAGVSAEAARARAAELSLFLASHDALTGLAARSTLIEHLSAMCHSGQGAGTLLLLDIDDFALVNDGLGHDVGDAVLLEVAGRISEAFPGWMVARHGGDEFAVVAPLVIDTEGALELGERVHAALEAEVLVGQHSLRVSASVGLAVQTPASMSAPFSRAHAALSQAKHAGTGQTRLYDVEMRRQVQERLRIQDGLRLALAAGELHVAYQPIVALATRRIVGAEALLRWAHPLWGSVAPAEFIPTAERTGLIVPIGQWVMETACNDMLSLQRDHGLYVSVNVAARQLLARDFAAWLEAVLRRTGMPPTSLMVELTESALMEDIAPIRVALQRLRSQGVRVAIDDFGTGYSSLARLQGLPVDMIKLDRAFVSNVDLRDHARGMASAILQMSAAIGASIVAEGVETESEADTLRDLGYEMAQGYLLAIPMPVSDLTALVLAERRGPPTG
jgi:diguanylate cyclase (GGDEF)-like protein/PAS domain S-box-containing protein